MDDPRYVILCLGGGRDRADAAIGPFTWQEIQDRMTVLADLPHDGGHPHQVVCLFPSEGSPGNRHPDPRRM